MIVSVRMRVEVGVVWIRTMDLGGGILRGIMIRKALLRRRGGECYQKEGLFRVMDISPAHTHQDQKTAGQFVDTGVARTLCYQCNI